MSKPLECTITQEQLFAWVADAQVGCGGQEDIELLCRYGVGELLKQAGFPVETTLAGRLYATKPGTLATWEDLLNRATIFSFTPRT